MTDLMLNIALPAAAAGALSCGVLLGFSRLWDRVTGADAWAPKTFPRTR